MAGLAPPLGAQAGPFSFHVLAYHDVVEKREQLESDGVTVETLVNHFEWLLAEQYQPVSIEDIVRANRGEGVLPLKAVLLCWDDGYASFYTHVLPLLKAYRFPAVLALVGDWMDTPEDGMVRYGDEVVPRTKFLSWEQVRAVVRSGLVEVASHSMNLHHGLAADSAGDILPAAIAYEYNSHTKIYETDEGQFSRIYEDLAANNRLIKKNAGVSPRVMVWPYGRYTGLALKAADKAGMPITLTLDPVAASTGNLGSIPRIYPTLNPETGSFKYSFLAPGRPPLRRFVQVQTDLLLEQNEKGEERFSRFLERVKSLRPGRVLFEPLVNIEGRTYALFRNTYFPVVQDRLLRLSWHTNRRAATEVHLVLSGAVFEQQEEDKSDAFFEDLGKSAPCSGLLIDDKAFAGALLGLMRLQNPSVEPLPVWNPNFSRAKRNELLKTVENAKIKTVLSGIGSLQNNQPFLDIGLTLRPEEVLSAGSVVLKNVLRYFDYVMIDLRYREIPVKELKDWLGTDSMATLRPYFSVWLGRGSPETAKELIDRFTALQEIGIMDYGYAYDDFIGNRPDLEKIRPFMSTRTYPFIPK